MSDLQVTIGFSTTNKLLSRIIRWVTRGKVSHAWISFYDHCLGMRLVMQAEAWGFEVRPLERWRKENILVSEYGLKHDESLDNSIRWIADSLGTKYDWAAALFAGIRRWLGIWIRSGLTSPKKLMCSEAVIRFLEHAGFSAAKGLDPETTPPAKLLEVVSSSDEFVALEKK